MSTQPPPPPPAGEAASAGAAVAPDASWDLYALLSIEGQPTLSASSSEKEIHTAYRRKAKQLHPDRNPDPKAAVLFSQLLLIYTFLSEPANRAAYDARLTARDARAAKDAALDTALATMKRSLLAREAEAAAAVIAKRNAEREAALNPRGARSAEEISREANEMLIRSMQAQGMFDQQQQRSGSARSASSISNDERANKAQRTSSSNSNVHAGSRQAAADHHDERKEEGDEKHRTLVVRWSKSAAIPSVESLRSLACRCASASSSSSSSAVDHDDTIDHVFYRPDKRKCMLVFARRSAAMRALSNMRLDQSGKDLEVKWMEDSAAAIRTSAPTMFATSAAVSTTAASASVPGFSSSVASSASSSSSAAPASVASFAFGSGPSANLSAADYEQATMMRMAAIAKQNKLKRQQLQQQQAEAQQSTPSSTPTDAAPATADKAL